MNPTLLTGLAWGVAAAAPLIVAEVAAGVVLLRRPVRLPGRVAGVALLSNAGTRALPFVVAYFVYYHRFLGGFGPTWLTALGALNLFAGVSTAVTVAVLVWAVAARRPASPTED